MAPQICCQGQRRLYKLRFMSVEMIFHLLLLQYSSILKDNDQASIAQLNYNDINNVCPLFY